MDDKPKKRGRKPKNEYYLTKKVDKVDMTDRAIIVHLPIVFDIPDIITNNSEMEQCIISDLPSLIQPYEDCNYTFTKTYHEKVVKDVIIKPNDTPILETSDNLDDKTYYDLKLLPDSIDFDKINVNIRTDICCYWCCHSFDTQPVFMPYIMKKDKFIVKGIFCSFECCLSYMSNSSKYAKNIHLLKYMYYISTGKKFFRESLIKAPKRECLKIFGGPLDITEFRKNENRYEILAQPMCYISGLIEKTHKKNAPIPQKTNSFLSDFVKKI